MTKTRRFTRLFLPALLLAVALAPMGLRLAGFACYRVSGDGMSPEIARDALVYVRRVEPAALREGQIVVFRLDERQFAVSRIVRRADDAHITVADDCDTGRELSVHVKNIVGTAAFSLPHLGALSELLSRGTNRAVLLCALGAAYLLLLFALFLRRGA